MREQIRTLRLFVTFFTAFAYTALYLTVSEPNIIMFFVAGVFFIFASSFFIEGVKKLIGENHE